ncbi:AAA family ATPase [Aneurinibacillus terranovensis]|uniref:AAA family ATPase n=1 Tax=Aneurinibacillus terranovensis TaxID=278991 RepID=UPI000403F9A5|nr:AAA family ATPase [Aneurinibacillus terranovensis]
MTTAMYFLSEWAGKEAWKVHVVNEVRTRSEIDSSKLLDEVLGLMQSEQTLDLLADIDSERADEGVLVINNIKAPNNISALSRDVHFALGGKLNVFYGENGSGKSSYVRMFRKLANNYYTSEKHLKIIPNVYEDKASVKSPMQTIEVTYTVMHEKVNEVVDINLPHPMLSKMNVFDSDSVLPLINSDLSFTVLPNGFELFQKVSHQLDVLRDELSQVIERDKLKQDTLFVDSSYDFIRAELNTIMREIGNFKDVKPFLDSNHPRSESYEDAITEIDVQIKELESSNPKDKITILSTQRTKLVSIKESIQKLAVTLSTENIKKINKLIKDYELKVQEEREFNELFQKSVSFLDVVNNEWLLFIKAGKKYYDSVNRAQIKEGEPCIFCSNPLTSTSVNLVESHFKHVNNRHKEVHDSLEKQLFSHDLTKIVISWADEDSALFESEKFLERIKSAIQLVNRNKELFSMFLNAKQVMDNSVILDVSDVIEEITQEISALSDRIDNLTKNKAEINELIASRKSLKDTLQKNEKLHLSLDYLAEWFQIRESVENHNKAKRKFSTNTLTQKQADAFKKLVQGEYLETFERFAQELQVSNVNLKMSPQKGQTLRKKFVASEEYKVSEIMSEGEQKAVAMVEFATDLTMRNNFHTVLFDDPVTSLDYKRSELIANLIYQLSLSRQVVVFTHNIMFYYYLYNACANEKNNENKFFKVDEFDKLNKGIVSETFSGRLETLKEITNKLKAQEQTINSRTCIGDVLEEALKKAYADIRTWCELMVEEGFFNSVVRRYEPNIRFTKVKDIKGDFVEELLSVNELFEKSCRWMAGHSQPTET